MNFPDYASFTTMQCRCVMLREGSQICAGHYLRGIRKNVFGEDTCLQRKEFFSHYFDINLSLKIAFCNHVKQSAKV